MKKQTYPMTEKGLENLKNELYELQYIKREKIKKRIQHARSFCDFLDESEYDASIEEQLKNEVRILQLKDIIQNVELIEKNEQDFVGLGSIVTYKDLHTGSIDSYQIVGNEESDPTSGKIAYDSPLATQLLGHKELDLVTVKIPNGEISIQIITIF